MKFQSGDYVTWDCGKRIGVFVSACGFDKDRGIVRASNGVVTPLINCMSRAFYSSDPGYPVFVDQRSIYGLRAEEVTSGA
jgi:hypothetical protein